MRWMDPNFDETRRKGRALIIELKSKEQDSDPAADSQQIRLQGLRQNDEKWSSFVDITNFFEALGVAYHHKQVDESIIRDFFRDIIVAYWNVFAPAIGERRTQRDNARVLRWFENLYDEMKT